MRRQPMELISACALSMGEPVTGAFCTLGGLCQVIKSKPNATLQGAHRVRRVRLSAFDS